MVCKLIGVRNVEFTDDKDRVVRGKRLYVTYDDQSDGMIGTGCDYKYFPDDGKIKLPDLVLNKQYEFVYQEQGLSGKAQLVAVKEYKPN